MNARNISMRFLYVSIIINVSIPETYSLLKLTPIMRDVANSQSALQAGQCSNNL